MKRYHIDIRGMSCQHCVKAVIGAAETVAGIASCRVDLSSNSAEVELDESRAGIADVVQAVTSSGYAVGGFRPIEATAPGQS